MFDREYFQRVWEQDVMTENSMMKCSIVQSQPFLSSLCQLTIIMLVDEVLQLKTFKKGQKIMAQSMYSPTNSQMRQYYAIKLSKFAEMLRSKQKQDNSPNRKTSPSRKQNESPF